mgnify:CR=1 FL=1
MPLKLPVAADGAASAGKAVPSIARATLDEIRTVEIFLFARIGTSLVVLLGLQQRQMGTLTSIGTLRRKGAAPAISVKTRHPYLSSRTALTAWGALDAGMMTRTRQHKGRDNLFQSCL